MFGLQAGYPGDSMTATAILERCRREREPSTMLVTGNDKGKWFWEKAKCQAFRGFNSVKDSAILHVSRVKAEVYTVPLT